VTRATRRAVIVFAIAALVAPFAFDWLHTSDEERVTAALDAMQDALAARDFSRLESWLAPAASAGTIAIPGFPVRKTLAESLAAALKVVTKLNASREETKITLDGEGGARAEVKGSAFVEVAQGGAPLSFEVELELRRQADGRFLLERVARARVDPLFH
jgi:hypothetical protein